MARKILRGLKVSDFIHPEELKSKKAAYSNPKVKYFFDSSAEKVTKLIDPVTMGTFVKIDETCNSSLIKIVRNVCKILDVAHVPDVYLCHLMDINIVPFGSENPYLVVPDYVLRYSTEDMLYYNVGNAVTMIKADHVELTTIASYMPGGMFIDLIKLPFTKYLHCADATSDRGGLLACQSFSETVRQHFWELGIPPSESTKMFTNDKDANLFVENYLEEQNRVKSGYNGILTRLARYWQNMAYLEAPANKMLRDLFNWYKSADGYNAILSKYA